uniref:Putative metalloprotease n=1 Tax=Pithovirus LCPAC201 TaxID=2506591 RepID=A0A481Z6H1_9VIRU|nr:MAG: putative metalloprotease [Pithovirus LCPAC201]
MVVTNDTNLKKGIHTVIVKGEARSLNLVLPHVGRSRSYGGHDGYQEDYGVSLTPLIVIANKGARSVTVNAHRGNTIDSSRSSIVLSSGRCVTLHAKDKTWYQIC